jgi:hypothetical protein
MRLRGQPETAIDDGSDQVAPSADRSDRPASQPRFVTDSDSGATVRWSPRTQLGDRTLPAYMVHPPYRGTTGYTFWQRDVNVPEQGRLELFTGMGAKAPERSDGVVFKVDLAVLDGDRVDTYRTLIEHLQVESRWVAHQVSLEPWAGRRVRLRFISDCGPQDNSTTDHSYWGDAVVVGADGRDGLTAPTRYMNWLNSRPFTSGFYFRQVRSKKVDLEFVIQGSRPVWIESITAHARPDVLVREFDHGVVLANPSCRPCNVNLARRWPGTALRRLPGSSSQDPATNNGQRVEATFELGPLDGLFLIKD